MKNSFYKAQEWVADNFKSVQYPNIKRVSNTLPPAKIMTFGEMLSTLTIGLFAVCFGGLFLIFGLSLIWMAFF